MDDLYLDGIFFPSLCPRALLRALVSALGIADEVDRLGLKGSKKKKSKKLDEDWMVRVAYHLSHASAEKAGVNSPYSSHWLLKRCQRSFKPCGRPRAARSLSSYSLG
jgi:hypothetical protein